jgi:hypothetical protein
MELILSVAFYNCHQYFCTIKKSPIIFWMIKQIFLLGMFIFLFLASFHAFFFRRYIFFKTFCLLDGWMRV